ATQSSRCGRTPNDPSRVSATIREIPVFSAKTPNGRRILRCMSVGCGMFHLRLRLWLVVLGFSFRFVNRPDHIERALRVVFEFIAQDSFAAVERIFEAYQFSFYPAKLLGGEERLREESLQPPGACDYIAVFWRQLF